MSDPDFIDALRERYLALSPHMAECGMQVGALSADAAVLILPWREDWLGDSESGRINPGVITVLVDSAAGLAVLARVGQREPIATLDLRMDYLRPAFRGAAVHCRTSCFRLTQSIAFVRATVWQHDEGQPIASAQLVFMRSNAPRPGHGGAP
ncbi:PaaI family thioesterase [Solimonas flava]|uniref:PaaI family thioesterase n=1 Tax=Solimonas flava TaxID=415849 RepID=UPI0004269234|nr:PaaI family thioesterase [Solimonas flava]